MKRVIKLSVILPVFLFALVLMMSFSVESANAAPANMYKVGQVLEEGELIEYVKDPTTVYFEDDHYIFLYDNEYDEVPEGKWVVTEITDDPLEGFSITLTKVEPTPDPTPEPTPTPSPEPTPSPTPDPTDGPTPDSTDDPSPEPTDDPTPTETAKEIYKITYIVDGKENKKTGNPSEYVFGEGAEFLKVVYKDGYEFVGWFDSEKKGKEVNSISKKAKGDITLYARFDKIVQDGSVEYVPHDDDLPQGMESDFGKLFARMTKYNKNSITIKWKKVKGADGYDIYGSRCNSKDIQRKYQYITSLEPNKTSYVAKKLREGTYFKFYVEAYKLVNGEKQVITRSALIHGTTLNKKYGVAQQITVDKTKVTIKVGEKIRLNAEEYNDSKIIRTHRAICFETSNKKIAAVTPKKGIVKGVKAGTCKIWVYAQNGLYTYCEVTVV